MNEVALHKEIDRIAKELRFSGELADSRFLELKAEVDQVKPEIAALRKFLEQAIPSFTREFPEVKEQIFRGVQSGDRIDPRFRVQHKSFPRTGRPQVH